MWKSAYSYVGVYQLQTTDFNPLRTEELVTRYASVVVEDFVGNGWDSSKIKSEIFELQLKSKNPKFVHSELILWSRREVTQRLTGGAEKSETYIRRAALKTSKNEGVSLIGATREIRYLNQENLFPDLQKWRRSVTDWSD